MTNMDTLLTMQKGIDQLRYGFVGLVIVEVGTNPYISGFLMNIPKYIMAIKWF